MSYTTMMKKLAPIVLILFFIISCKPLATDIKKAQVNWTIAFYMGADNNLETALLNDFSEIQEGFQGSYTIIVLIDRPEKGISIYQLTKNNKIMLPQPSWLPLDSSKQNSASATTLGNYISYIKKEFPAKHYALFLGSHGEGARSRSNAHTHRKLDSLVVDQTSGEWIYTADFSRELSSKHSIDLFAIDACFMGNAEFLYELRPRKGHFSPRFVVTHPSEIRSQGWEYAKIFQRLTTNSPTRQTPHEITASTIANHNIRELSPLQFGQIIIEEGYNHIMTKQNWAQAIAMYDMSKIEIIKSTLDELIPMLVSKKDEILAITNNNYPLQNEIIHYFNASSSLHRKAFPYFDFYDIFDTLKENLNEETDGALKNKIDDLHKAISDCILYSTGDLDFEANVFKNGKNGLSIFFPKKDDWKEYSWYSEGTPESLGLSWCIINNNSKEEPGNWYNLLQNFFDD